MFCRSAPLFCKPNRKTGHINFIMLCVVFAYSAFVVFGAYVRMCLKKLPDRPCTHFISLFYHN